VPGELKRGVVIVFGLVVGYDKLHFHQTHRVVSGRRTSEHSAENPSRLVPQALSSAWTVCEPTLDPSDEFSLDLAGRSDMIGIAELELALQWSALGSPSLETGAPRMVWVEGVGRPTRPDDWEVVRVAGGLAGYADCGTSCVTCEGTVAFASFAFRTRVARSGEDAVPGDLNMLRRLVVVGLPIFCVSFSSAIVSLRFDSTHRPGPHCLSGRTKRRWWTICSDSHSWCLGFASFLDLSAGLLDRPYAGWRMSNRLALELAV